jgi:DNA-binding transcriptional MocR family regulator
MVVALWRDPRTEHLLEEGRTAYRNRRAAFVDELGREGLSSFGRSGVHVWVPVPREGDVVQGMLGFGWAVQAGEPFRLESGPAVRIGLANLTSGHAREAAADLVKVLQGPRRVIS